jgi:hypothetical protein
MAFNNGSYVSVQKTNKNFKAQLVVSWILTRCSILAIIFCFLTNTNFFIPLVLFSIGVILKLWTRLAIWWTHG